MTVFVDASDSGWGVVLCFNGETRIFGGSWSGPERAMSINVRELSSARIAIRLAASQKTDDVHMVMHFNIDNTSAQSWLQKQRAPVFVANAIVADVAAIAGHHNITNASIRHVASAWNPPMHLVGQDNLRSGPSVKGPWKGTHVVSGPVPPTPFASNQRVTATVARVGEPTNRWCVAPV